MNVLTLAFKDLRLLGRNYPALFWITVFPVMLALLFGAAFSGGGQRGLRALPVGVVDGAGTPQSKALVERLRASSAVTVSEGPLDELRNKVRKGDLVAYLRIDPGFGRASAEQPGLELGIDPTRMAELGVLRGILVEVAPGSTARSPGSRVKIVEVGSQSDVPQSSYEVFFPAAILWGVLACVQHFVISIATERAQGTFLRLRISPLSWGQILGSKGLACFLISSAVSGLLLALGHYVFHVRLEHPWQVVVAIVCSSLCFVGMMMFLSTLAQTVEGVSGVAWGVLMPLAMIGGAMIPLISMPNWMVLLSNLSPVKWAVEALEGAIWRGFSWPEMALPCILLLACGLICFSIGVRRLSWGSGVK